MKAPAMHYLLQALLGQSAAYHTPEGAQVLHHIVSANFRAFTSLFTQQLSPSLKHKFRIPSQLESCKSVSSVASWNGPQVDCEIPGTGTPRPWTQLGHLHKYADEVCVDWSCSRGPWWPAWESQNQNIVEYLLPASALCTPGPQKSGCPTKRFFLTYMPSFRAGGALASHAGHLLSSYTPAISELFAHGLSHLTDTTVLHELFCLAYMRSFRVGGALGGPGRQV
eukprot:453634-Pelagomonas_calceolata.AAC.2